MNDTRSDGILKAEFYTGPSEVDAIYREINEQAGSGADLPRFTISQCTEDPVAFFHDAFEQMERDKACTVPDYIQASAEKPQGRKNALREAADRYRQQAQREGCTAKAFDAVDAYRKTPEGRAQHSANMRARYEAEIGRKPRAWQLVEGATEEERAQIRKARKAEAEKARRARIKAEKLTAK